MSYDPETYGKPERPGNESEYSEVISELADLAEQAGVELPGIEEARTRVVTSKHIVQKFRSHRENPEDAAARIANALVVGDVDLDEAARELAHVEAMAPDSILARAVNRTAVKVPASAFSQFRRQLDGDKILGEARESAVSARKAIVGMRSLLNGVRSAEEANARGSKVAASWSRYTTELLPKWEAAHELVKRLRALHLIQPLPLTDRAAAMYGRFDLAQENTRQAKRAGRPILKLLDDVCDEWHPTGPHTAGEAAAFCDQIEASDRALDNKDAKIRERFRSGPKSSKAAIHAG